MLRLTTVQWKSIMDLRVFLPVDQTVGVFWVDARARAQAALTEQCEVVQGTPEGVEDNGSLTRVAAFPIGIDPERFARALDRSDVKAHIAQLLNRYAGRKVRSGVRAAGLASAHACITAPLPRQRASAAMVSTHGMQRRMQ